MNTKEKISIGYRLNSFRILRLNYAEPENSKLDYKPGNCLFRFSSRIMVNFKHKRIGIRLLVEMNHKNGLHIGEIETESIFDILGFEKLQETKDKIFLPDDFVTPLISPQKVFSITAGM